MNSLVTYALEKIKPTKDQLKLLAELDHFFSSDCRCFLLKGYAGTGKTFITKCIADYLKNEKLTPVLMAPTGRAARIIQIKTYHDATTIHKAIYNLNEVDEIKTRANGKENYKFRYGLNHIEDDIKRVYLVDEASMISDKYAEDDFFVFGSGRLLKDMMHFVALGNNSRNNKVIFIGDSAQLPPVTDNISGALSKKYLLNEYQIEAGEYELTEVVRQESESGILANATYLRELLQTPKRNSFKLNTDYMDVFTISTDKVVMTFANINRELDTSRAIVINHSNQGALDYNLSIRNELFPGKQEVQFREVLMINQNNYNYSVDLLNGTLVKVKEVSMMPEIKSGMKSYDENGEDCEVTHRFRRVIIEVPDQKGTTDVSCLILDSFLYSPNPTLDYAENISLYIDFKIRHPQLKAKTKEFADALRKDPYFNALRVKFGYAVTCHKAQGGEWDTAIVNLDVSQSKLSDNFLRWTYTAISRAKSKLYLFNIPETNQFSTLQYSKQLLKTENVEQDSFEPLQFELPINFDEQILSFGLNIASNFLTDKFIELLARFYGTDIEIIERKGHQFQEAYIVKRGDDKAGITFWYNGKMRFTRANKTPGFASDEKLLSEVMALVERPFNFNLVPGGKITPDMDIPEIKPAPIEFPEDKKSLEVLYVELERCLDQHNATITGIRHNNYQEQYTISRKNEAAVINFYYDGRNRFTNAGPHLPGCNSNKLLKDIASAIDQIKIL